MFLKTFPAGSEIPAQLGVACFRRNLQLSPPPPPYVASDEAFCAFSLPVCVCMCVSHSCDFAQTLRSLFCVPGFSFLCCANSGGGPSAHLLARLPLLPFPPSCGLLCSVVLGKYANFCQAQPHMQIGGPSSCCLRPYLSVKKRLGVSGEMQYQGKTETSFLSFFFFFLFFSASA